MADYFCRDADFHETSGALLHAVNQRHGTHSFTSLPKEGALRIFFALKNPTASAWFHPANLGTKGQPLGHNLLVSKVGHGGGWVDRVVLGKVLYGCFGFIVIFTPPWFEIHL
jgi:hypothetical protein